MTAPKLGGMVLHAADIEDLASRIRETDRLDCAMHECDAGLALLDGLRKGPCWAVTWENQTIGALGWTYDGYIWSLWVDLTREQSKAIMARTRHMVRALVRDAARPLGNTVREDNLLTIAWLRASKCFDFIGGPITHEGHRYLPFFAKPLGDL
jgi:integrase